MMAQFSRIVASLLLIVIVLYNNVSAQAQIQNFDKAGRQVMRFSTLGDAVDAHDGEIAYFGGTYYLYGTSYDCGFEWNNKTAPFCGFKVYSSKDLNTWTDRGFLFNAQTPVWQTRCDGKTYGCFRPHVIYNAKTKQYVLWINVYDNRVGYRVFTSKSPAGPFQEVAEPRLAVNSDQPVAGLNNGDHDTFVDSDGTAYLAYTDWRTKGSIVIEKLSGDYLTGTGEHISRVTSGETEAPGLFKRNGIYYLVYSDPNCGYCPGTGTSYKTARSPLGPWSAAVKISDNSCGGQPSFVSTIKINNETVYLYGSDLWNNAAKNEALANFYWAPLAFAADGTIKPLNCPQTYKYPKATKPAPAPVAEAYLPQCDIAGGVQRSQVFTVSRPGTLAQLSLSAFQNHRPDAGLQLAIYHADAQGQPAGNPLFAKTFAVNNIGWSAKNIIVHPGICVKRNYRLVMVLKSANQSGCYGVLYKNASGPAGAGISNDGGRQFQPDGQRALKFAYIVR